MTRREERVMLLFTDTSNSHNFWVVGVNGSGLAIKKSLFAFWVCPKHSFFISPKWLMQKESKVSVSFHRTERHLPILRRIPRGEERALQHLTDRGCWSLHGFQQHSAHFRPDEGSPGSWIWNLQVRVHSRARGDPPYQPQVHLCCQQHRGVHPHIQHLPVWHILLQCFSSGWWRLLSNHKHGQCLWRKRFHNYCESWWYSLCTERRIQN